MGSSLRVSLLTLGSHLIHFQCKYIVKCSFKVPTPDNAAYVSTENVNKTDTSVTADSFRQNTTLPNRKHVQNVKLNKKWNKMAVQSGYRSKSHFKPALSCITVCTCQAALQQEPLRSTQNPGNRLYVLECSVWLLFIQMQMGYLFLSFLLFDLKLSRKSGSRLERYCLYCCFPWGK